MRGDPSVQPFYNFRDQIYGLLLNGQRIIVPLSMRKEMKSVLHTGHVGIERTKARARESLFWHNIRDVPMGAWGASRPPLPNAHETAKKLVIKQIL